MQKILHKNISNSNPTMYKNIIHHNQVGFIPGIQTWLDIKKSVNVIHHTNRLKKEKSYKHINRCRKVFDRIQHPFN